jgi:ABC-type Fe3+-hydroxamate transport system substrate-binding protein
MMSRKTPVPNRAALTDAAGRVHGPAGRQARIACFVPSITELVIDLGLAAQLVARTQYCIHPAAIVRNIPAIGGTKKVSVPKLKTLAPSHAILNVDENTREMDAALRKFVPNVIVTHPNAPDEVPALIRLIGGIFGRDAAAAAMCAAFEVALASLRAAADLPARRVCYFCWKDPWMTVSRDTYISRSLALINWATVGHRDAVRYPEITVDEALLRETDLFLFSTEPYAFTADDAAAFAAEHGVPPERCLLIDGEYTSWYGSRAIAAMAYLRDFAGTHAVL